MEYTVHNANEGYVWLRFYMGPLPFETCVKEDDDYDMRVADRLADLERDFQAYGDYLNSPLAVFVEYKEEENGN